MNRRNVLRVLWSGRFSALVALVGLGLLFTASGAKAAGCGLAFKTAAAPVNSLPEPSRKRIVEPSRGRRIEQAC